MLPGTSIQDSAVPAGTSLSVKDAQPYGSVGRQVNLVGEPDAGNPHVRFDERGVQTEQGRVVRHRHAKGLATRAALPTPPRLSSTLLLVRFHRAKQPQKCVCHQTWRCVSAAV
jgi:hypothetical protein